MKRRWSIPIAACLSMLLVTGAAAEDCTPLEPKKWEGTLTYGGGGWVGTTVFELGGCSWGNAEAVDRTDTIVWDVADYNGATVSITSKEENAVHHHGLSGYFLNEDCERGGSWGATEAGTPYTLGIPEGAKWILVYQVYGGANTVVTMETPGRVCEEPEPPKPPKKKKPKRP